MSDAATLGGRAFRSRFFSGGTINRTTRVVPFRAALLAMASVGLAGACAPTPSSEVRERLCAGSGCTDECRGLDVEVCDIRERACQELVFQSVRCVRGGSLDALPRTDFVPQTRFGNPDAAVEMDAGVILERPPEEVAQEVWDRYLDEGLQLMHLIATPLAVAKAEEGKATGGVTTGGSVAIADNNADQLWWSMRLLAHEYVHTLQDYDYGGIGSLYTRHTRSSVTAQGVQAFIEGEAELYAWLAHAFMRNTSPDAWNLDEYFELDQKALRDRVAHAASPWTPARQWQHYAIGARYLYQTWKLGHNLGVRSVMYNLEPDFGAWVSDFAPRKGPKVTQRPVCEPAGNPTIMQDSLGPSGVFSILMAASQSTREEVIPTERAWRIATDLTEDVMRMYAPTYGGGISQAEWMKRDAKAAMCDPKSSAAAVDADAGRLDGPASRETSAPDAQLSDGATSTDLGGEGSSPNGVVCDAGAPADVLQDAGQFPVSDETPFTELQKHLIPGAPVWVSWVFGFETDESAAAFESWLEEAQWPTLRVYRKGQRVSLRTRRAPTTDAESDAYAAWTCD